MSTAAFLHVYHFKMSNSENYGKIGGGLPRNLVHLQLLMYFVKSSYMPHPYNTPYTITPSTLTAVAVPCFGFKEIIKCLHNVCLIYLLIS